MLKLKIQREVVADIPAIKLDKPFWRRVGLIVEASLLDNIRKQQQADGKKLKTNAAATRESKRRRRLPLLSLVDAKHRFVKGRGASWRITEFLANGIIVGPATSQLKKLNRRVQNAGYTGWMGLGASGKAALRAMLRKHIRKELR